MKERREHRHGCERSVVSLLMLLMKIDQAEPQKQEPLASKEPMFTFQQFTLQQ